MCSKWFRSEPMEYISIIINEDAARDCLSDLGKLGIMQFTDLNPELTPFQRRYVSNVKRCDELERKLRYFATEIDKFNLDSTTGAAADDGSSSSSSTGGSSSHYSVDDFLADKSNYASSMMPSITKSRGREGSNNKGNKNVLKSLESEIEMYETHLQELNTMSEKLMYEYNERIELQEVFAKAQYIFMNDAAPRRLLRTSTTSTSTTSINNSSRRRRISSPPKNGTILEEDGEDENISSNNNNHSSSLRRPLLDIRFSYITGVITTEDTVRFERMIFRTTRGNCFVKFEPIEQKITDPRSGQLLQKSVFIVFYKSDVIEIKIKKICDAFQAHRYSIPSSGDEDDDNFDLSSSINMMLTENAQDIVDSRTVLIKNQDARYRLCEKIAQRHERWTWIVLREKSIYHTLNMFRNDVGSGMLRCEGWVSKNDMSELRLSVERAHSNILEADARGVMHSCHVDRVPQPWPTPPTYFVTNKFTYAYQEFVNTYGIPRYREVNPAVFTAATFPFLFGVMYGDIGHGFFIFAAGVFLVWNESYLMKSTNKMDEMTEFFITARYMILLMGFFAVYAGFVYNDFFSLGLNLFRSRWIFDGQDYGAIMEGAVGVPISDYGSTESVYPFGFDPVWHVSSNELFFYNSFKMKMSVIFGILQMFMGTCLRGLNAIHFGARLDLLFEVLPMMIFSAALFLYMVVLLFMKWSINWEERMQSATCFKPEGNQWQSEWTVCDYESPGGNGKCTPWGFSCDDSSTTADKCPLDYGGSGDGCQPPNIITTLINIMLSPGTVEEPMYPNQARIQNLLLLCAALSVPVLLLAKPFFIHRQAKKSVHRKKNDDELLPLFKNNNTQTAVSAGLQRSSSSLSNDPHSQEGDCFSFNEHDHEDDQHDLSEIFIHQGIETIEFVLGMVSNTASYLRLWALSLAHTELASVAWKQVMITTLNMDSFLYCFLAFGLFAGATFLVLLVIDVLECALHTLRLHWVEFQQKFYKGDGVRFVPLSFKQVIKDAS